MKIQHIEVLTQKKKVRDITVAKNSNFVANGLVVHNCKDNVQKFMQKMKPSSVLDIAIATSIFRPGPMGLDAHNIFLKNRTNPEEVTYVHPVLEEVLGYTGGLLIFQEQLQLIVNRLSGMHLDDTDSIRKAFTKKDKSNAEKQAKEIQELGKKFVTDSMSYSGIIQASNI
jgi:DNA polymerase III alpha subunit